MPIKRWEPLIQRMSELVGRSFLGERDLDFSVIDDPYLWRCPQVWTCLPGDTGLTFESGNCLSPPIGGAARMCCHSLHILLLIAKGTEVVWEVAEDGVCWSVWFMLQLKHSLQGKMAAWWSVLPRCGDMWRMLCQQAASLWYAIPGNFALSYMALTHQRAPSCVWDPGNGHCSWKWVRKIWKRMVLFFSLCAACLLLHTLVPALSDWEHSVFMLGWVEKEQCQVKKKEQGKEGNISVCDTE